MSNNEYSQRDLDRLVSLLNRLLEVETVSILAHLRSLTPWAGPQSQPLKALVDGVADERRAAIDWLSEQIADLGRTPQHALPPADLGGLYYLSYEFLLTRIVADQRKLVDAYRTVAPQLAGEPLAHGVNNLSAQAAEQLAKLEQAASSK